MVHDARSAIFEGRFTGFKSAFLSRYGERQPSPQSGAEAAEI
jgi:hypothetical protein